MKKVISLFLFLLLGSVSFLKAHGGAPDCHELREKAVLLQKQGNYGDALKLFESLALEKEQVAKKVAFDMERAVQCLNALNRRNETDKFREKVIKARSGNWYLLESAAENYLNCTHYGYIISGEFLRGDHRGGGRMVNSFQRDRVRALQLFQQALPLLEKSGTPREKSDFYLSFASAMMSNRSYADASWQLQYLSNLKELPDYEKGYYGYRWGGYRGSSGSRGAPVDASGNPVFYNVPQSWNAAANDGQRWRWLLWKAEKVYPECSRDVQMRFADFLRNQFGVQTVAYFSNSQEQSKSENGPYSVHTLSNSETIARLATGIKRFVLPEEFNFISIYRRLGAGDDHKARVALERLADIFSNRRQYPTAADFWKETIKKFGKGRDNYDQIVGDWGRFEVNKPQAIGTRPELIFRYRNASEVILTAREIKVQELLDDTVNYIKSNPKKLDWRKMNIQNIGSRLVWDNLDKYLGETVKDWTLPLKPLAGHFDKQRTIQIPIDKAGAYLITARLKNGNISRIIVWLNDQVIVSKKLSNRNMYFVADAVSGKPVSGAKLNFFGYYQKYLDGGRHSNRRKYNIECSEFQLTTDANGLAFADIKDDRRMNWLVTVAEDKKHLAYLGFNRIWTRDKYYDHEYNQRKTYIITDRPVYKPGQTVEFKAWVRNAKYDQPDTSNFAGQSFEVKVYNPKGEDFYKKTFIADEFGGISGKIKLPEDSTLGTYRIDFKYGGGLTFRVEEYRKPEYEVEVQAPSEPVKLGDKIKAVIKAKYYFGQPVTDAKVKYKVQRYQHEVVWYPWAPWDWLYGAGYWWFGYDCDWYPGWQNWGCVKPGYWWLPPRRDPPELVMENEVKIEPDGTVEIEIDSSVAKAFFGNLTQRYEITAEVVDLSRRTIVGKGKVIASPNPFKVYCWLNKGYVRTGDTITASFSARTANDKVVKGNGVAKLFRIKYNRSGVPKEHLVQEWDVKAETDGTTSLKLTAGTSGQYRLAYTLTDSKSQSVEGATLFTVIGKDSAVADFRYNALELINDKREYVPGDKVDLMINTAQADSTVILFVRAANGICLDPKVISIKGKTAFELIEVLKKDMPNFYVEALTVSNGRVHDAIKEIVVPPEKRVLNVDILPEKSKFKPGEKASIRLKITDYFGKPIKSTVAMTVYDKAIEYISGGSNVTDIQPFFWKWRRRHYSSYNSNVNVYFYNLLKQHEERMQNIGVFGQHIAVPCASSLGQNAVFKSRSKSLERKKEAGLCEAVCDEVECEKSDAEGGGAADKKNNGSTEIAVRKNFADTAFWAATLTPDANGEVEVVVDMPENLTTWKITAWGMANGTKVGQGTANVITSKDFIIRVQTPRFLVEKDETVFSAIIHNYHSEAKTAEVSLELAGGTVEAIDGKPKKVKVPSGGDVRVSWNVRAVKEGLATVTMKAVTSGDGDAMQLSLPVHVHGMSKMDSFTGSIPKGKDQTAFEFIVPRERRLEETLLEVNYSPSIAMVLVDALPYLAEYPYGCTEQTLNRFLPAVITRDVLTHMGVKLEDIKDKIVNLNPQELGDASERAKQWKRWKRNPVFDNVELNKMIVAGLKRLEFMQLTDGGWGWFSGWGEHSSAHITAMVVHGLKIAKDNGVKVDQTMFNDGLKWLEVYQKRQLELLWNAEKDIIPCKRYADNIDALVFMVLVENGSSLKSEMKEFLYRDRNHISVYGKSMLGLTLLRLKDKEKLDMVMKNIKQYLVMDKENQTAYLNLPNQGYWWWWYGSEFEAMAYYLKLLSAVTPESTEAAWLAKYLVNNRKHATYWNSTRDSAICIEALADYLKGSKEDKPDMTVEIFYDGKLKKTVNINSENLFSYDSKLVLKSNELDSGKHKVKIKKKGKGNLYFNAYLSYFTLENFIHKTGLEIKVEREFYRLVKVDENFKTAGSRGQVVTLKKEKYQRVKLKNLSEVKSGDLVEVELTIESKNDYEYILFKDMKAAGFEPCEVRSGYNGNDMGAYVEFRESEVCFFVQRLARGKHSLSYRLYAETPGLFSALPATGLGMYAPELKANSDEIKLRIKD